MDGCFVRFRCRSAMVMHDMHACRLERRIHLSLSLGKPVRPLVRVRLSPLSCLWMERSAIPARRLQAGGSVDL